MNVPTITILEDFESATAVIPRTGGWVRSTSSPYSGTYSLKSNIVGKSYGVDTATFTIDVPAGATNAQIELYARVSSEMNWDWLTITLNGVQLARISGTVGWTRYTAALTTGKITMNTLEVTYTKDVSYDIGEDSGFIDNIKVTYDTAAQPAWVTGYLMKGNQYLEGLVFSLREDKAVSPKWYDYTTGAEGYFEGVLPGGSYIIEGIWIPQTSEWYPIALRFDINGPNTTDLGIIQLRPDLAIPVQRETLALTDTVRAKVKDANADALVLAEGLTKKVKMDIYDLEPVAVNEFTDLVDLNKNMGTGTLSIIQDASAQDGYFMRANGFYWAATQNALIPFEPNTLYEVRVRVRQVSPPTSGIATFYAGVEALKADGKTFVNNGGANLRTAQHYVAASGATLSSQWTEYVGYFRGTVGTIGPRPDPKNPSALNPGAAYFRPIFVLNYNNQAASDAITDIDYQIIRKSVGVADDVTAAVKSAQDEVLNLLETVAAKPALSPADAVTLADTITSYLKTVQPYGWDFGTFDIEKFDVLPVPGADALALLDAITAKVRDINSDAAALVDAIRAKVQDRNDDAAALAEALVLKIKAAIGNDSAAATDGVIPALTARISADDSVTAADNYTPALTARTSAAEALSLADSITNKAKLQLAEAIALLDNLAASFTTAFADAIALDDSMNPRPLIQFQEAINLADGILALFKAVQGDPLALSDTLWTKYKPEAFDDAYAATDDATASAKPSIKDVATLADSAAAAIKVFQADVLALADALSLAAKAKPSDMLPLLDDIGKKLAAGAKDDAMGLADDLAKKVMLNLYDLETIASNEFTDLAGLNRYTSSGGATITTVQDDSAQDGYVMRANGYWWGATQTDLIPYEPNTLYEVRARVRQVSPPTTGSATFYAGVEALAADGRTFVNGSGLDSRSSQHYIAASGVTLSSEWTEYVGYFRGTSTSAGGVRPDPKNPARLYEGAAYFRPIVILNYSGGDGVVDIDYQVTRKSVGTSDDIAATMKAVLDTDPADLADNIVKKIGSAQADLLSALDAIKAKAQDVNADTSTPTDSIAIVTKRLLADTLTLTDDIYRAYKTGVLVTGGFDFGSFDNSVYDDTGDLITLADSIDVKTGFGNLGADILALADAMKAAIKATVNDPLAITDALARKIKDTGSADALGLIDAITSSLTGRNTLSDQLNLAEALALVVKNAGNDDAAALADDLIAALAARQSANDTLALADTDAGKKVKPASGDASSLSEQLAFSFKKTVDDMLDLTDNLLRNVAAVLGDDSSGVTDNLALAAKVVASEVVLNLADDNKLKAMVALSDLMTLSDAKLANIANVINEIVVINDTLRKAISVNSSDVADLAENVKLAVMMGVISDTASLADGLTNILRLTAGVAFDYAVFDDSTFDNSGDQLGVIEAINILIQKSMTDSLPLADDIKLLAKTRLADTLSLVDTIAGLYGIAVASPGITLVDSIGFKAAVSLSDALSLAENLANKWTTATEDGVGPSDYLILKAKSAYDEQTGTAETLTANVKAQPDDQAIALADNIVRNIKTVLADTLTLADAIAPKYGIPLSEALDIAEDVVFRIWLALDDSLTVADTMAQAEGRRLSFQETAVLMDESFIKTSRQLADTLALIDAIQSKARLSQADAVAAADILGVLSRRSVADTLDLMDEVSRLYRYVLGVSWDMAVWDSGQFDKQGDFITVGDDYRFALAALLQDVIAANESLAAKAGIQLGDDSTGVTDQIINAINSAVADSMGISDQLLQLLMKIRRDDITLSLADLLANKAALPPDDASTVADSILSALKMARSADDLLATTEDLLAKVKATLQDVLVLTDSATFSAKKAIAEAIAVAEALGLKTKRPLPGDAVGIIDELYLKYALGIGSDDLGDIADSIRGKVKTLLQQVFINGVSVPVNGLNIRGSGTDRVGTATFRIPSPSADVINMAQQRAQVNIYLVDGIGNTDYFSGRIMGNPTAAKGSMTTEMEVTVDDWTAAALDVYVVESFPENWGTISEALRYLWDKYYGYEIDFSGLVSTPKTMPSMVFNYMTLFEVTERLAQLLGWSWHVDWTGADRVLNFYPPSSAVQPVTLSREARNIAANTARFGQSDTIANVVYVFGGNGISQPYTQRIVADGKNTIYKLGAKPHRIDDTDDGAVKITLITPKGVRVPQRVGILNLHEEDAFDCLMDFNEATIRWREDNLPKKYADGTADTIEANYRYSYPIMVQLTDDSSIKKYGRIELTVNDNSLQDTAAARDFGRAILRDRAYPKGFGSCEVFVPGLRAGQFITVDMPAYNTVGLFEIAEIEKWIQGGTVRRRVTLNKTDNPESRIAERLKDFVKRLASLEAAERKEDVAVQRYLNGPANIGAKVAGRVNGSITDSLRDNLALQQDDYILSWKSTGQAKVRATDTARAADDIAAKSKKPAADAAAIVDKIGGGITFFDVHKFGDASHPWGM